MPSFIQSVKIITKFLVKNCEVEPKIMSMFPVVHPKTAMRNAFFFFFFFNFIHLKTVMRNLFIKRAGRYHPLRARTIYVHSALP